MMPAIAYRLDTAQVQTAFDSMWDHLDEEIGVALELCGDMIAAEARTTTKFRNRSNKLRQDIRKGKVIGRLSEGEARINVSANVYYARFIEHGTRYIDAREFLKDALDAKRPEIHRVIEAATDRALERAGF